MSLVVAFAHCIHHGFDMASGLARQKAAVAAGYWPLYRYDPRRADIGENPLQVDSSAAKGKVADFLMSENRFKMLTKSRPEAAKQLFATAQVDADRRWKFYQFLQSRDMNVNGSQPAAPSPLTPKQP